MRPGCSLMAARKLREELRRRKEGKGRGRDKMPLGCTLGAHLYLTRPTS